MTNFTLVGIIAEAGITVTRNDDGSQVIVIPGDGQMIEVHMGEPVQATVPGQPKLTEDEILASGLRTFQRAIAGAVDARLAGAKLKV